MALIPEKKERKKPNDKLINLEYWFHLFKIIWEKEEKIWSLIMNTHRGTVVNNFHFIKFNVFWVTPKHGQNKIVSWWDRLVDILKEHIQKVLQAQLFKFIPNYCQNNIYIYRIQILYTKIHAPISNIILTAYHFLEIFLFWYSCHIMWMKIHRK